MTRRFSGGRIVLALTTLLGALIIVPGGLLPAFGSEVAQAATSCPSGSDIWTGGSGEWSAAGSNWSTGQIPQSQTDYEPDVCIQSGTVVLNYQTQVNSISVLSGATLDIYGQQGYTHGLLTLTNQDAGVGIAAGAAANFGYFGVPTDNGYETHGGFVSLSGTLVNDGAITSEATGDETANLLYGNFDNEGSLTIDNALNGQAGNWILGGTVTNTSGQQFAITAPGSAGSINFTGAVANGGTFAIGDGINVTASSGTETGNDIIVGNGIVSPSGSGTGTFHVEGGSAQLGSNIASGYTIWSSGIPGYTHGNLTTTGSYTNNGVLELGSIDGTHGTLTIPSGDTFTNAGTLTFENTANGADGLNGALDNTATVSVENQFQGSGDITNDGTMELAAVSGQNGAASFTQGSAGTLTLDVTGGGTPVVPGLQLTGKANTGGTLKVVTTGGTATGTFPVITSTDATGSFATTFSGESYSLNKNNGTLSLVGPATSSSSGEVTVSSIKGGNGSFSVKLSCAKSKVCVSDNVIATTKEIKKVRGHDKTETKTVARKVVVVASGTTKSVTIPIAKSLLVHGSIQVIVYVTSGNKTIRGIRVVVKPAK